MFRTKHFTEHAGPKAAFAVGNTALGAILEQACRGYPVSCAVVSEHNLMLSLLALMLLDVVTGMMASRWEGTRVTSRRLGEGVKRKFGMLCLIAGSLLLGSVFSDFGIEVYDLLYRVVTSWFIAVEFLSLYENVDRLGVRLPAGLKRLAERLLQKTDEAMDAISPNALAPIAAAKENPPTEAQAPR